MYIRSKYLEKNKSIQLNVLYSVFFFVPYQFRKGFKKMVLGLGCTIMGKKPQDMTIEGYLRQVSSETYNIKILLTIARWISTLYLHFDPYT